MPNKKSSDIQQKSILTLLRQQNKSNIAFEEMINRLTLEELIAIKLELSYRNFKKVFNFSLWKNMPNIAKDALLKFTYSLQHNHKAGASFLGIDEYKIRQLYKKFKTNSYFPGS